MARIYHAQSIGEAQINVALVSNQDNADLLVYKVASWGDARGDALWFITTNKEDASCRLFFTSQGFAQIKVCFVKTASEAGWKKESRYRGRIG